MPIDGIASCAALHQCYLPVCKPSRFCAICLVKAVELLYAQPQNSQYRKGIRDIVYARPPFTDED
jgi:hypothetical protein